MHKLFCICLFSLLMVPGCASWDRPKTNEFRIRDVYLTDGAHSGKTDDPARYAKEIFPADTGEIMAHVMYQDLAGPRDIRWEWVDPGGTVYTRSPEFTISPSARDRHAKAGIVRHRISVKDEPAELRPGRWKLRVYLDGALARTASFTLEAPLARIERRPPYLIVDEVLFSKSPLDAGDTGDLTVTLKNTGPGEARDVFVYLTSASDHLTFAGRHDLPVIVPEGRQSVAIPVTATKDLATGQARIDIRVVEPHFNTRVEVKPVVISTRESMTAEIAVPRTNMYNPDAVAVIIGNRHYQSSDIPEVRYAVNDANAVRQFLIHTLGYQDKNIIMKIDAKRSDFNNFFGVHGNHRGLLSDYIKDSSDVFVYYSGHGAPDLETRKGYFVPVDCLPDKVNLNGYSLDLFYENLYKLNARAVTVVIDACFSGGTPVGVPLIKGASPVMIRVEDPSVHAPHMTVFTSSTGDQISSWYDEKRHGLFTWFFLQAISGAADHNGSKQITYEKIHKYVADPQNGVPYYARRLYGRTQTPEVSGARLAEKIMVELP